MPADLLLPAFFLTLLVNAVFVAIAVRALRDGLSGRPGAVGTPDEHAPARPVLPDAGRRPPASRPPQPPPLEPPPVAEPDAPVEPDAPDEPAEPDQPAETTKPIDQPAPAAEESQTAISGSPPKPTSSAEPPPAAASPSAAKRDGATPRSTRSGRRRKFSLPPMDEDHEKVSRSIETFLGVSEAPTVPASPLVEPPTPASADPSAPVAVVTVAVIQLEGDGPHDLLQRTVRSTARAADRVTIDRRGRIWVVLTGTGEVAAKAYLRRIRAIVEPIAEAEDPPSRIVIATATEIDGAVAAARRRADRRLAIALRRQPASRDRDGDDIPEPRAAGD